MNVISRDFSYRWDFRSVAWQDTLIFNMFRAFCAGIPLGCLMAFAQAGKVGVPLWQALVIPLWYPFAFALAWLICLLPMALFVPVVAAFFPPAALVNVVFGVVMGFGDPLVCMARKFLPGLVRMDRPPLFSPQIAIVLLKPTESAEVVVSSDHASSGRGRR